MIADARGLPVLSRKTPAQEGAGEGLLAEASSRKTTKQITEFLKKGVRRRSESARIMLLLRQSRLRSFPVVPLESGRRTIEVRRRRNFTCFIQKNVEVMQVLYVAHTSMHACSSERRFLARKRAVLARTFHIAKSRGYKETIVLGGVSLASSGRRNVVTRYIRKQVNENGLLPYLREDALSSMSLRSASSALESKVRQPQTPSSHQNCFLSTNSKLSASPMASLAASAFSTARSLLR